MTWAFFKRQLSLAFVALLIPAFAFSAQTTAPKIPTVVKVNPDTLKTMLLEQNISLMIQLNKVYQAKEQVNISRAQLLPSINLGSVISSGPSFALTSVSMLLPFLLPSNWFDLKESQQLLNAQTTSYYIAQLNTYSSAYSVYATVVGDMELREVLYKQYLNYKNIEDLISLAVDAGMMQQSDLLQAQSQTQLASIQVSQVDDLLQQEKAAIRDMLALPLNQEIVFDKLHVPATPSELLPAQTILDRAMAKAPEVKQLDSMIAATKTSKWSKAFSFLTGASLGTSRLDGNSAFDSVTQTGTVKLSFGYLLGLKLTDYNIDALKLQKTQITYDQGQMVEATLGSLVEAQKQIALAQSAETNLQLVYDGEVEKFKGGLTDLLHVLAAANSLTTALTNKVKAQSNIDTLRISLNRILIEDRFAQVGACTLQRKSSGGITGRLGRVFKPTQDQVTLDQACGPQTLN